MSLFSKGDFTLHSGRATSWRINCEALTDDDLEALAHLAAHMTPDFGDVYGVPNGGIRFAHAMWKYRTAGPLLIVDDVYTTGQSMREAKRSENDVGLVIFARSQLPPWITAVLLAPFLP